MAPATYRNPVVDEPGVDHGDPFVLEHLGRWFVFHSGWDGVRCWSSADLVAWRAEGIVLAEDGVVGWAQVEFWAPEVVYRDGEFLMYVAATRRRAGGGGDDGARRLGLARASAPTGPYRLDPEPLLDAWAIDAHPCRDEHGEWWLFYNVRTEATRYRGSVTGCGNVVDRLLGARELAGSPTEVAFPSERWEGDPRGTWYWNEGAVAVRRRGTWHQMYSGGFWGGPGYAIGQATAPSLRGPWTKDRDNPLFVSGRRLRGPGHHSLVVGPDGVSRYACFHARAEGARGRQVCVERAHWAGDRLQIGGGPGPRSAPSDGFVPVPPRGWCDPGARDTHTRAWVRGDAVRVGGASIPLADGGLRLVEARRVGGALSVRVDGVLRHEGPADAGGMSGCEVASEVTTACLDDEAAYALAQRDGRRWAWTARGAVEVTLAVRGAATVYVGDVVAEVPGRRWRRRERFRLVRVVAPSASEIAVEAGRGGATVADLLAVARRDEDVPGAS